MDIRNKHTCHTVIAIFTHTTNNSGRTSCYIDRIELVVATIQPIQNSCISIEIHTLSKSRIHSGSSDQCTGGCGFIYTIEIIVGRNTIHRPIDMASQCQHINRHCRSLECSYLLRLSGIKVKSHQIFGSIFNTIHGVRRVIIRHFYQMDSISRNKSACTIVHINSI